MAFASVTMCLYMTFLALTLRFGAERQNHDASTPGTQGPLAKLYARAIESALANSLRNSPTLGDVEHGVMTRKRSLPSARVTCLCADTFRRAGLGRPLAPRYLSYRAGSVASFTRPTSRIKS